MMSCDLNCDLGEGIGNDAAIMPFISSANIACGFHAGNGETMLQTVALCRQYGVAIGAHPSFPDRENFGRVDLLQTGLKAEAMYDIVGEQLQSLQEVCQRLGVRLHHVKPHGALYNRAAKDEALSEVICRAIRDFDPALIFYGLSGSCMKEAAERFGLRFYQEVFADRTYQPDGSLTPRTRPDALILEEEAAVQQALQMVRTGTVRAVDGSLVPVSADTVCLHGDGPQALGFAQAISEALRKAGIRLSGR